MKYMKFNVPFRKIVSEFIITNNLDWRINHDQ